MNARIIPPKDQSYWSYWDSGVPIAAGAWDTGDITWTLNLKKDIRAISIDQIIAQFWVEDHATFHVMNPNQFKGQLRIMSTGYNAVNIEPIKYIGDLIGATNATEKKLIRVTEGIPVLEPHVIYSNIAAIQFLWSINLFAAAATLQDAYLNLQIGGRWWQ